MSSSNQEVEGLLPPSPYMGVRPPTNIEKCDRKKIVYGFPLSHEWLAHRYHHEVELDASEGAAVEEKGVYTRKFLWHLLITCQRIHKVKCTSTIVETSGYGDGLAMFLVVGYPGRKPPPETLETLIDKLADYGVVEKPGWYPRA